MFWWQVTPPLPLGSEVGSGKTVDVCPREAQRRLFAVANVPIPDVGSFHGGSR